MLALFVAVTGFAVAKIPDSKGVIHACYKKKGGALRVVSGKKCRKGTRSLSWNQKGRTGTKGAPGVVGKQGAAGTAVAYARVAATGALETGDSGRQNKNVVAGNVEHVANSGYYCFGGLPFAVASAMVSTDSAGDINGAFFTSVAVQRGITLGNCDAQHQQARVTTLNNAGAPTDHRFQIWFEATGGTQIAPGAVGD